MSRSKKKGKAKYSEADFEAFLKESISDEDTSLDTARISEYLDPKKKKKKQTLTYDVSDDDNDDIGRIGTGTRFMKSSKIDPPIPAMRKTPRETDLKRMAGETDLSRDSLDDVSFGNRNEARKPGLGVPALSLGSSYTDTPTESHNMNNDIGMDTLQEMKEKERFFDDLQKRSGDETLDYSKLNRELDGSATLAATALTKQETLEESADYRDEDNDVNSGDEEYRDQETEDKKPSMLAKVSLLDSLDSTLGTKHGSHDLKGDSAEMKPIEEEHDELEGQTEQSTINRRASASKTMDFLKIEPGSHKESADHTATNKGMTLKTQSGTGTGFHYTDTSHEIQALQDAMRQIGTGTMDMKDLTLQDSSASALVATGQTANTEDITGGFGMKPVAPPRSDKSRTVDDIIREVEELRTNTDTESRGFAVHQTPAAQKYDFDKDLKTGSFNVHSTEERNGEYANTYNDINYQEESASPIDKYPPPSSGSIDFHSSTTTAKKLYPPDEDLPHSVPDSQRKGRKFKNKYAHVKGSGYGRRNLPPQSPPKKSSSKPSNNWSPADKFRDKVKGTESLNKKTLKVSRSSVDENLMQSVQSFANYIQQQFSENSGHAKDHPEIQFSEESPKLSSRSHGQGLQSALIAEAQDWRNQWKEERKKFSKLQGELATQEREHHEKIEALRVQHEEEMFHVKQENFILTAKVEELEKQVDDRKRIAAGGSLESASSEQAERLEKEIRDQEKLLAGYQSENERLYQEMKKIQGETKATQERIFRENERLKTEVRSLRENLERKEVELKNKGLITGSSAQQQIAANSAVLGAGRIAHLEAQLRQGNAKELSLQREVEVLRKAKEELEKHVDELVGKIAEFEEKVKKAKSLQSQEVKDIEKKYENEMEKLQRKLKWYAENQDLLDKDSNLLRKKDAEIKELNEKVEFLQTEHGRRQAEAKARMKERNSDSKKIQDLQRQVREMENILRKRNPNSLPVLMWAASSAPEPEGKKTPSVEHLENRIKKLESELDEKDEESKRSLRVMEQKYNAMKVQFEDRQRELEERLLKYERPGDKNLKEGVHPHTHVGALEKELDSVKERYKKRLVESENEADRLRKEISVLRGKEMVNNRNEAKSSKDTEVELQVKLKVLQNDLSDSQREKQFLQTTIDRLQKEKQQLIIDATKRADKSAKPKGLPPSKAAKSKVDSRTKSKSAGNKKLTFRGESDSDSEHLPPMSMTEPNGVHNSLYQPQNFAQSHVDDILRENEDLKQKLDRAEWEKDSHRVHLQKLQAEAEARDRRLREDAEEQITALRVAHQHEMQRLLSDHAIQHSVSRVAELQAKVDSQELMIRHLRHQVAEGEVDQEHLSTLKIKGTTMESRIKELTDELEEAKKSHAPEMRHFEALQEKIRKLESKHTDREQELQSLLRQSHAAATAELQAEIAKWKRTVELKNKEIEHFRLELDNILEVLKELRRQGVILPGYGSQLSLVSGRSAGSAYTSTPR